MSKRTVKHTTHRARFDQFKRIGKFFPDNGEGLKIIGMIEEFHIGFGFDSKGKIIGFEWNTRYSLAIKESIEFDLAMIYLAGLTECPIQVGGDDAVEQRWLAEILNAMR